MKKYLTFALTIFTLLLVAACSTNNDGGEVYIMDENTTPLSIQEVIDKLADIIIENEIESGIAILNMEQLEFIGRIWRGSNYPAAWRSVHADGYMNDLWPLQGWRSAAIFIDHDSELLIGIERPSFEFDAFYDDALTVPENTWIVAFARQYSGADSVGALWELLDQYLERSGRVICDDFPAIELYPGGPGEVGVHLLFRPIG